MTQKSFELIIMKYIVPSDRPDNKVRKAAVIRTLFFRHVLEE